MIDPERLFDGPWPPSQQQVRELLDEVCTDAYGEAEQVGAIAAAFDDWGELPRQAALAGTLVSLAEVEPRNLALLARVKLRAGEQIAVPLEDVRPPDGTAAAWLTAAWRLWLGMEPVRRDRTDRVTVATENLAPSWTQAEEAVRSLPLPQIVGLVADLYAASHANRNRLHCKLGLPPAGGDAALLAQCGDKLTTYLSPHHDAPFQLAAALDVIDHYAAATLDAAGTIELLVHGLECGSAAMQGYGDLFSEFYETMSDIAFRCAEALADEPSVLAAVKPRLIAILEATPASGYGFPDSLDEALCEFGLDD